MGRSPCLWQDQLMDWMRRTTIVVLIVHAVILACSGIVVVEDLSNHNDKFDGLAAFFAGVVAVSIIVMALPWAVYLLRPRKIWFIAGCAFVAVASTLLLVSGLVMTPFETITLVMIVAAAVWAAVKAHRTSDTPQSA